MIITVASGKGGTGKTTVATSLALSLVGNSAPPIFLDCDVEEPNAALFLRPILEEKEVVGEMVPRVDLEACTYCGRCAEVCQFNAIAVVGQKVLTFPEICHGCGSCTLNCPEDAISEVFHPIGTMERGHSEAIDFGQGTMNVGEPMAVPIIRQLKRWTVPDDPGERTVIIDAPPGSSCPVVESMRGADFVLMVTEPTPFGLHDLRLAVEVARDELGLLLGVVINRDGVGDTGVETYCEAEEIPILMRIPLDRRIAVGYSDGIPLVETLPAYRQAFLDLHAAIGHRVAEQKRGETA